MAATARTGALGVVIGFLARRPALLAPAIARYSRLATVCVLVVGVTGVTGVTGVLTGLVELGRGAPGAWPESLWTTGYGLLVLVKAVIIMVVGGVAVVVRRTMMPLVARRRPTAVARWCGAELALLSVAFGVAAVLTRSAVAPL